MLAVLSLGLAATTAFLTFRWWRRARLATKERLVREGALVAVAVTGRPFQVRGWKTRTTVDLEGNKRRLRCVFNRWFLPSTGDTIQLLHHRAVAHVVAFDRDGAMYSGHVIDGD